MKELLVISNHPPDRWGDDQKAGWDSIDYIPFPEIPPDADFDEVCGEIAVKLADKIGEWIGDHPNGKVNLQGEFTVCYILFRAIDDMIFVFPTTKRETTEIVKEDGSVEKKTVFKFVRWR